MLDDTDRGQHGGVWTTKIKTNGSPRGGTGRNPTGNQQQQYFYHVQRKHGNNKGGSSVWRNRGLEIHNKSIANWAMGDTSQAKHMVESKPTTKVSPLKRDSIWATQNGGLKVHIECITSWATGGTTQATIIEDSKSATKVLPFGRWGTPLRQNK